MSRKIIFACVLMSLAFGVLPAMADPGRGADILCYVWANNPSPAIGVPYSPSSFYSYNSQNRAGGNTVTKTGTGTYSVTCRGVGGDALPSGWGPGGHVQVTAYGGEDADYCKVQSWATGGADFTVTVRCYNSSGALSDNRFDLLFVW
jgi:hypothetical protein